MEGVLVKKLKTQGIDASHQEHIHPNGHLFSNLPASVSRSQSEIGKLENRMPPRSVCSHNSSTKLGPVQNKANFNQKRPGNLRLLHHELLDEQVDLRKSQGPFFIPVGATVEPKTSTSMSTS